MNVFRLNRLSISFRWIRPDEGRAIVLLQAALLVNAALVIGRSDWVEVTASLAAVAVCGGVLGYLLAKTTCPDVLAHLTAAIVGMWAIGFQVLTVYSELGASRRDRFAELIDRARVWYRGTTSGNQQDDTVLFAFALAFTLWLVSLLRGVDTVPPPMGACLHPPPRLPRAGHARLFTRTGQPAPDSGAPALGDAECALLRIPAGSSVAPVSDSLAARHFTSSLRCGHSPRRAHFDPCLVASERISQRHVRRPPRSRPGTR